MTRMKGPAIGPSLDKCWDDLNASSHYQLGDIVEGDNGKAYRFVRFMDAVTYVKGHVVCVHENGDDEWEVTNDVSGNLAGDHPVGVVFQETVPTTGQYGFVQIGGVAEVLAGSAITAGDFVKPDAATDGAADAAAAGTHENILGVAVASISDTENGNVLLRGLRY